MNNTANTDSVNIKTLTPDYLSEMTVFLGKQPWDYFCHLTFEDSRSINAAHSSFHKFIHNCNRKLYGHRYYKNKNAGVAWVRADEQQLRGAIHFHALIGQGLIVPEFNKRLTIEYVSHAWQKTGGNCQIQHYNPQLRGIEYLLKTYGTSKDGIALGGKFKAAIP